MTPVKRFPGRVFRGTYSITGALRVDASGYITGPLEGATGLIIGADASFARRLDCASGIDVCGLLTNATRITSCGAVL